MNSPQPDDLVEWLKADHMVELEEGTLDVLGVFDRAAARIATLTAEIERRDAVSKVNWGDQEDQYTEAVNSAHPMATGDHKTYETALEMVNARKAKYELVSLVNWLLTRAKKAESGRDNLGESLRERARYQAIAEQHAEAAEAALAAHRALLEECYLYLGPSFQYKIRALAPKG